MTEVNTPADTYRKLDQTQRTELARECIAQLNPDGDPACRRFTQMDVSTVTPEQLGNMHEHIAHRHPAILEMMLRHPIFTGVLAAFAARELNKHLHRQ